MPDFTNAKSGDKIRSLIHGDGIISHIDGGNEFPFCGAFEKRIIYFDRGGFIGLGDITPCIYPSGTKIEIKEPPKMVEKRIEGYVWLQGAQRMIDGNGLIMNFFALNAGCGDKIPATLIVRVPES